MQDVFKQCTCRSAFFFYIRLLTIVILANVECSQRNILQYCTVLYNISYLWNRFVTKETTYFRFVAMSVFTYVNRLFGIKRKKAPLNSQRTIKLKSQFFIQSSNIHDILHVISSILQKISYKTSGRTYLSCVKGSLKWYYDENRIFPI